VREAIIHCLSLFGEPINEYVFESCDVGQVLSLLAKTVLTEGQVRRKEE